MDDRIILMEQEIHIPDTNRLSVVTATVLLAYAVSPFIAGPGNNIQVQLPGFLLTLKITFGTVISFLGAGLAGSGAFWLLHGHPVVGNRVSILNGILPALTAWAIGVPLNSSVVSLKWWVVLGLGGVLLVIVLVAEYIVLDEQDVRLAPATSSLTAVSFALLLTVTVAAKAAGMRLYLLLPAIAPAVSLVAWRTLHLRLGGKQCLYWALAIGVVVGQLVIGFQYWPLSPMRYGLLLLGPAYALTTLAFGVEESRSNNSLWVEPLIILVLVFTLAAILG